MSITPDLETLLDRHGVFLICMEFYGSQGQSGPSVAQVTEFFAARGVLAGVSAGATYGSNASVVANIAAMLDDDSIVVASQDGRLSRGQEATVFFAAAAYALQAQIIVDEGDLVTPDGEITPYPERELVFVTAQSLSIFTAPTPAIAITALLALPATGQYGRVGNRWMVLPQTSFQLNPAILSSQKNALPLITFEKSGELRLIMLGCSTDPSYTLTVTCGPRYTPVGPGAQGSPAAELRHGLCHIPLVMLDDDQVAYGHKAKEHKFGGREQLAQLTQHAAQLNQCEPSEFFVAAARTLGLGQEVEEALAAFEAMEVTADAAALGPQSMLAPTGSDTADSPTNPPGLTDLAGYPLTTVSGTEVTDLQAVGISAALEGLLKTVPDGDLTKMTGWQRFRRSTAGHVIATLLACLGLLLALVTVFSGTFAAFMEMGSGSRVFAGIMIPVLILALTTNLLIYKSAAPARQLVAQARNDGVLR